MTKIDSLDCVLLIDDDDAVNFLNEMIVKRSGIQGHVQSVISAREGLDYLLQKLEIASKTDYPQPGIIFLDINMPGMDGWGFLEEYKDLPPHQKARVIIVMLTTSLNPADEEKAKQYSDVREFRHKPLTIDTFKTIAQNYFELN